ncbi:fibrinogen-like protein A [Anopheles darlingi]|uniref:fibrinogen-like protein A n=1 Tax=Anopheles darlingi TaxID=43151 RepID=UPI0021002089|nr:fibrinogen-like protein A [Anopheles darlingi]
MQKSEMKMLQNVEDKIQEHRTTQEQLIAELHEFRSSHDKSQSTMLAELHTLENRVALNLSEVYKRNQENINAALHKIDKDIGDVLKYHHKQTFFPSCKDVPSNESGTYRIRVKTDGVSVPFEVYCEQKSFGGGWIVFQYRFDGSLDFYRDWNEFRDGFGDLNKEFWLGLEKVHQITSGRKHELIVELKDFEGTYKYARYDTFEIGSESDQYDLKHIGNYSGTAGEKMSHNKGSKFSTKDRDNDEFGGQCARLYEGAWWHFSCTAVNLNGRYINDEDHKAMFWYDFKDSAQGLSYSRMMIRELE